MSSCKWHIMRIENQIKMKFNKNCIFTPKEIISHQGRHKHFFFFNTFTWKSFSRKSANQQARVTIKNTVVPDVGIC